MDPLVTEILLYKAGEEQGLHGPRLVAWVREVAARKGLKLVQPSGDRPELRENSQESTPSEEE